MGLNEDTHAKYAKPVGNYVEAYNNALKYAKKENRPFIYGYAGEGGKFFALDNPISCPSVKECVTKFKQQYKNAHVVYVAYPDKDFVKESLDEDYEGDEINNLFDELNYYAEHDEPLDMDLLDSALKESAEPQEPIEELSDCERHKQRALEYYNKVKDWAGDKDALNRTSCKYNVGVDQLNEWIEGETKND